MNLVNFTRPVGAALVALATLMASPAASHDFGVGDLSIDHPHARPNLPNRPTAGYMTIANTGDSADRLTSARSDAFGTIELHTVEQQDGVMKMLPIEAIEVPAGGTAVLEPGGLHLMLFDAADRLKIGDTFDAVLTFEKAGEVMVTFNVEKVKHGSKKMQHDGDGHSGHGSGHSGHGSGG